MSFMRNPLNGAPAPGRLFATRKLPLAIEISILHGLDFWERWGTLSRVCKTWKEAVEKIGTQGLVEVHYKTFLRLPFENESLIRRICGTFCEVNFNVTSANADQFAALAIPSERITRILRYLTRVRYVRISRKHFPVEFVENFRDMLVRNRNTIDHIDIDFNFSDREHRIEDSAIFANTVLPRVTEMTVRVKMLKSRNGFAYGCEEFVQFLRRAKICFPELNSVFIKKSLFEVIPEISRSMLETIKTEMNATFRDDSYRWAALGTIEFL